MLPVEAANKLYELFSAADFEQVQQMEPGSYVDRFRTDDPTLPGDGDYYLARFKMSKTLHTNPLICEAYERHIYPFISEVLGIQSNERELICYKMTEGDVFRLHKDDYAGRAGFVYYLCKNWQWDWGGLLHARRNGSMTVTRPGFNTLELFDHRQDSPPHFVSMVMPWATEPRYMLVGLLK